VLRFTALHHIKGQEGQLHLQQGSPKPPNSLLQYYDNLKEILPLLNWFGGHMGVTVAGFTHLGVLQFSFRKKNFSLETQNLRCKHFQT